MTDVAQVLVCSPNAMVQMCIKVTLSDDSRHIHQTQVVGQVSDAASVVRYLACNACPDVVIMHDPRWSTWTPEQIGTVPTVVAVSDEEESGAMLLRGLRGGVSCMVSVATDLESLPRACHLGTVGLGYISPVLVGRLTGHLSGANRESHARFGLTPREAQVLQLLTDGHPPSEIARVLRLQPRTVKHNLSCVYRKLGVDSATGAVVLAYKQGLAA